MSKTPENKATAEENIDEFPEKKAREQEAKALLDQEYEGASFKNRKEKATKTLKHHFKERTTAPEKEFQPAKEKESGVSIGNEAKRTEALEKEYEDASHFMIKRALKTAQGKLYRYKKQKNGTTLRSEYARNESYDTMNFVNEFVTGALYKRILGDRTPIIDIVTSDETTLAERTIDAQLISLRSKFLHSFQTISQFTNSHLDWTIGPDTPKLKQVKGAEKLFAANLFCGEHDKHAGNNGVMTIEYEEVQTDKDGKPVLLDGKPVIIKKQEQVFAKIDPGWSASLFFTNPVAMMKNFATGFEKYEYANNIALDIVKFKEAIDEIAKISDDEIETIIKSRVQRLKEEGFDIKDLKFSVATDDITHEYDAKTKITFNNFDEYEKYYIEKYKAQRQALKGLSNMLEVVIKATTYPQKEGNSELANILIARKQDRMQKEGEWINYAAQNAEAINKNAEFFRAMGHDIDLKIDQPLLGEAIKKNHNVIAYAITHGRKINGEEINKEYFEKLPKDAKTLIIKDLIYQDSLSPVHPLQIRNNQIRYGEVFGTQNLFVYAAANNINVDNKYKLSKEMFEELKSSPLNMDEASIMLYMMNNKLKLNTSHFKIDHPLQYLINHNIELPKGTHITTSQLELMFIVKKVDSVKILKYLIDCDIKIDFDFEYKQAKETLDKLIESGMPKEKVYRYLIANKVELKTGLEDGVYFGDIGQPLILAIQDNMNLDVGKGPNDASMGSNRLELINYAIDHNIDISTLKVTKEMFEEMQGHVPKGSKNPEAAILEKLIASGSQLYLANFYNDERERPVHPLAYAIKNNIDLNLGTDYRLSYDTFNNLNILSNLKENPIYSKTQFYRYLIENNIQLNSKDFEGISNPLIWAIRNGVNLDAGKDDKAASIGSNRLELVNYAIDHNISLSTLKVTKKIFGEMQGHVPKGSENPEAAILEKLIISNARLDKEAFGVTSPLAYAIKHDLNLNLPAEFRLSISQMKALTKHDGLKEDEVLDYLTKHHLTLDKEHFGVSDPKKLQEQKAALEKGEKPLTLKKLVEHAVQNRDPKPDTSKMSQYDLLYQAALNKVDLSQLTITQQTFEELEKSCYYSPIQSNKERVLQALIATGANLDAKEYDTTSPLQYVIQKNLKLLSHDGNNAEKYQGVIPLPFDVALAFTLTKKQLEELNANGINQEKILQYLINNGLELREQDFGTKSPLRYIMSYNKEHPNEPINIKGLENITSLQLKDAISKDTPEAKAELANYLIANNAKLDEASCHTTVPKEYYANKHGIKFAEPKKETFKEIVLKNTHPEKKPAKQLEQLPKKQPTNQTEQSILDPVKELQALSSNQDLDKLIGQENANEFREIVSRTLLNANIQNNALGNAVNIQNKDNKIDITPILEWAQDPKRVKNCPDKSRWKSFYSILKNIKHGNKHRLILAMDEFYHGKQLEGLNKVRIVASDSLSTQPQEQGKHTEKQRPIAGLKNNLKDRNRH